MIRIFDMNKSIQISTLFHNVLNNHFVQDRTFDLKVIVQNDLSLFAYTHSNALLNLIEIFSKKKDIFGELTIFKINKEKVRNCMK